MVASTTLPHARPMKRLYLLRHAKSSWKDATLADHDRPLAGRGRRASKEIARQLCDRSIEPELVLCSTARRARETLDRIAPALGAPAVEIEPDLYVADARGLLERLRSVADAIESVLLIGHNPAMQELAIDVARPSPTANELAAKYPTAALAVLTLKASTWRELGHGTAELVELVKPRDLE
jgi:phosphohistidine phosphatase